jgi:hypothetical protein
MFTDIICLAYGKSDGKEIRALVKSAKRSFSVFTPNANTAITLKGRGRQFTGLEHKIFFGRSPGGDNRIPLVTYQFSIP